MQEGDRPAADASSEPGIQVGLTSEFTLFSEPYDADGAQTGIHDPAQGDRPGAGPIAAYVR
jgi:hypothetical protein